MSVTAKLFIDGGDQAVDLPDECRFEGTEVRISKVGDTVILEPLTKAAHSTGRGDCRDPGRNRYPARR
jgi:virulence-associated protein VagC